jgi:hypothetical protein
MLFLLQEGVKEEGPAGQQCAESLIGVMNALNLQKSVSDEILPVEQNKNDVI